MVLLASGNCFRVSSYVDAAAVPIEVDVAVDEGEEGVVFAHTDILAGVPLGAALTNDDVASDDGFAAKFFDAETVTAGVASVLNRALSFFMCHCEWEVSCLSVDAGDFQLGHVAAEAFGFVVTLATLEFESNALGSAKLVEHFGGNCGSINSRAADAD